MKNFEGVKIIGKGITRGRRRNLVWKILTQVLNTAKLYAMKNEFHDSHHILK